MADSKSITMKDVAREAGVALGTVSKVVNGIPVGKTYQRRVEDAIEKLGYHVNRQARALRSSQSNSVRMDAVLQYIDYLTSPLQDGAA